MRPSRSSLSALASFFLLAAALAAQVPSRPEIVGAGEIENLDAAIENLSRHYFSGRWDLLQKEINGLKWNEKWVGRPIDPERDFYLVVFVSREEDGAPRLVRFAWHTPAAEPYAARIPGRKEIYEIVLGAPGELELKTSYVSTQKDNPLLEQVPKFIKRVEPVVLDLLAKKKGPPQVPAFNVEVRRVRLPFARARIRIDDGAVLGGASFERTVKTAASRQAEFLAYRYPGSKALIADLDAAIQNVRTGGGRAWPAGDFSVAVETALKAHLKAHPLRGEALERAVGIESEFLEAIATARTREVKGDFEYENIPPARFSFGLASAILLGKSYADDRVRLTDDGYYLADPPDNPLAAVILNFHPVPYDSEASGMTPAERFRLFGGVVLNPDLGLCAGAGFGLLRGLSLNAGLAIMAVSAARDPQAVVVGGRDRRIPGNPNDPFDRKWRAVGFVGFGYSF